MTRAASALQRSVSVLDLKCRECGQTFKTPAELEEHVDRVHLIGKKDGGEIALGPPNDSRR
jgi:uncharacterized C2H2 Zn-finger protein